MAKKIKFPLEMGDGERVRTLDELRDHFDAEKLVGHFASGKLQIWLSDRHYQAEYEQVAALDVKCGNLLQELCRILRIERTLEDVKVDEVLRRQRLEREISQYTDDEEILSHLERVAVDQEQLDSLLKSGCPVIYLLGEHFQIPGSIAGTQLSGINMPVLSVDTQQVIDFEAANVVIHNCRLDEAYCALREQKQMEEELAHKKKRRPYKASDVLDYKLSEKDRKESEKLYHKIQEGLVDFEFDVDAGSHGILKALMETDLWNLFDIDRYGAGVRQKIKEADLDQTWNDFLNRIS